MRDSSCFMYPLDTSSRHLSARYSHNYIFNHISSAEGGWKGGWEPKGASHTALSVTVVFFKGSNGVPRKRELGQAACQMRAQPLGAQVLAFADEPIQKGSGIAPAERSRALSVALAPPTGTGPCCSQPWVCIALRPERARKAWLLTQVKEHFGRSQACVCIRYYRVLTVLLLRFRRYWRGGVRH